MPEVNLTLLQANLMRWRDKAVAEAAAEGEARGRAEGRAEGLREAARRLLATGTLSAETVARTLDLDENEVRALAAAQ